MSQSNLRILVPVLMLVLNAVGMAQKHGGARGGGGGGGGGGGRAVSAPAPRASAPRAQAPMSAPRAQAPSAPRTSAPTPFSSPRSSTPMNQPRASQPRVAPVPTTPGNYGSTGPKWNTSPYAGNAPRSASPSPTNQAGTAPKWNTSPYAPNTPGQPVPNAWTNKPGIQLGNHLPGSTNVIGGGATAPTTRSVPGSVGQPTRTPGIGFTPTVRSDVVRSSPRMLSPAIGGPVGGTAVGGSAPGRSSVRTIYDRARPPAVGTPIKTDSRPIRSGDISGRYVPRIDAHAVPKTVAGGNGSVGIARPVAPRTGTAPIAGNRFSIGAPSRGTNSPTLTPRTVPGGTVAPVPRLSAPRLSSPSRGNLNRGGLAHSDTRWNSFRGASVGMCFGSPHLNGHRRGGHGGWGWSLGWGWNSCYPWYGSYWNDYYWPGWGSSYSSYSWWPSSTYLPSYLSYGWPSSALVYEREVPVAGEGVIAGSDATPESLAQKYVNLGDFYFREERFAEAADAYARARTYLPNDPSIHFLLSDATFATGDYHFAAFLIGEALRLDPAMAHADADKRTFYGKPQTFEVQIATLDGYLKDKPYDAMGWLVLGYNMKFSARPEMAKKAFLRVLEIEPENRTAKAFLEAMAPKPEAKDEKPVAPASEQKGG